MASASEDDRLTGTPERALGIAYGALGACASRRCSIRMAVVCFGTDGDLLSGSSG